MKNRTTLAISPQLHDVLLDYTMELEAATNEPISFAGAIEHLLENARCASSAHTIRQREERREAKRGAWKPRKRLTKGEAE